MEQPETAGSRVAGAAPRDHDVGSFDRRAGSYERDWRSPFHAQVVAASVEVALAAVPHPAAVLAWRPVYDLGPLPLIGAVVAAPARPGDACGAGYRPGGNG